MEPRNHVRVTALALLLVLVFLAGCSGDSGTDADAPTPQAEPSEVRTIEVVSDEPTYIEAGTYRMPSSAWSVVDYTVTFPVGWTVQYGHVFGKNADEEDELGWYSVVVDEIFTDACHGEGIATRVGPEVDDLVTALRRQKGSKVSRPMAATVGGVPATRVDLTVPRNLDLTDCRLAEDGIEGIQVWYAAAADKYLVVGPDSPVSVYVLEVEGRRQVFLTQHRRLSSEGDLAQMQSVLDSIRIES